MLDTLKLHTTLYVKYISIFKKEKEENGIVDIRYVLSEEWNKMKDPKHTEVLRKQCQNPYKRE